MGERDDGVTREQLELAIWRLTEVKDAAKVDQLLDVADGYAASWAEQKAYVQARGDMLADQEQWTRYGILPPTAYEDRLKAVKESLEADPAWIHAIKIVPAGGGQPMRRENPPGVVSPCEKEGHPPFISQENDGSLSTGSDEETTDGAEQDDFAEFDRILREVRAEREEEVDDNDLSGDADDSQVCTRCKVLKRYAAFSKDCTRDSGYRAQCRACCKIGRQEARRRKTEVR